MVSDDAVAGFLRAIRADGGGIRHLLDERAHQVDIVIGMHALKQSGHALKAHAGINGGAGQGHAFTGTNLLILHEHEVPEFEKTVAVFIRAAGRAAGQGFALIVENFRAGAAGAGVAHRPEIVGGGDADDAIIREASDFLPQTVGFIVVVIDGDEQLVLRELVFLGDQVPGKFNRIGLEIVAEGEIAEHFEERVVARGVADVIEIVVLAASAYAFLRGCSAGVGALFNAGEDILELDHPGVGEHQGGIVPRHER